MTLKRPTHPLMLVVVSIAVVFALHNATFWSIWAEVFDGFSGRGVAFSGAFFLLCCGLVSVFVGFVITFALIEEGIATAMTNFAPLFGVEMGEVYITASGNDMDVVLFHSVVVFVPQFLV